MKKPNITQGEWKYEDGYVVNEDGEWICLPQVVGANWDISEMQSNAQAISAVPEMIDSLVEARKEITHYQKMYYSKSALNTVDQIEQALKKAGCHETDKI